ncbi:MAG: 16S rRNA (guanine(527)-N(7))-methyltransferase RsmG [Chitinispirillales bacterium]|jgi:16S rRNA (guanine527-N7)-methyltransferase|nr:16S rRNA (guanine(527)-N(7))-methyltransferase RsmG [Chitinispirillales bacterium]
MGKGKKGRPKKLFVERAKTSYESKELERLGLSPEPEQRDMILTFLGLVLEENKGARLVPEADEDQLFLRHFCDSLQPLLLFGFKRGAVTFDIGSSGGFPVFPVRIFRPDISFVLVEPNQKKFAFLERAKAELGFDNLNIVHGKAENIDLGHKADYVITRGTGTLHKFAQQAKPLLAKDGHMYMYKTKQFAAELEAMTPSRDGVKVNEIAQYDLGNVIHGLSLVSMIIL